MSTALTVFNARIDQILQQVPDAELSSADRDTAMTAALEHYSKDRPKPVVADVTGNGGHYYAVATALTSWERDFSSLVSVEYPAASVTADEEPQVLEPGDYAIYEVASRTQYLYLPNHSPAATETIRVTHTARYQFSGTPSATDTPASDFEALGILGAYYGCLYLAVKYGQSTQSSLAADSVSYITKSGEYARRAKDLLAQYNQLLGIGKEVSAAGLFGDWDKPGPDDRDFLFHRRRQR